MTRSILYFLALANFLLLVMITPVNAHAFAQRYDLPVPLWLYLLGAGATVALSFLMVIIILGRDKEDDAPRLELLRTPLGRILSHRHTLFCIKTLSVFFFLTVIIAGLFGTQTFPEKNILPTTVWVIWWVGLAFFSALLGDLWNLINPWRIIAEWTANLSCLHRPKSLQKKKPLSRFSSVWPAVIVFAGFSWAELVWPDRAIPFSLAIAIIIYSTVTWIGMYFKGIDEWLSQGEAFTILYGLFAKFSRIEYRVTNNNYCKTCYHTACQLNNKNNCTDCSLCFRKARSTERRIDLRPYGVGLLTNQVPSISMMVFILLVLATVSFDGFADTPAWMNIFDAMVLTTFIRELTHLLDLNNSIGLITSLGIIATPFIFFIVYITFCFFVSLLTRNFSASDMYGLPAKLSAIHIARIFIYTLIPIAIAYHLAHFLTFFLIYGQQIIPLISDPFAYGWDLFGTASYEVDIAFVGAKFAWISSITAIVIGHVVAVFLSHIMAMRIFDNRTAVLRSQYPMLVLMVGYTMISLWILSQPIVES